MGGDGVHRVRNLILTHTHGLLVRLCLVPWGTPHGGMGGMRLVWSPGTFPAQCLQPRLLEAGRPMGLSVLIWKTVPAKRIVYELCNLRRGIWGAFGKGE